MGKQPYYIDDDCYLCDEETELSTCLSGMSVETQSLIAAAPDMLEALEFVLRVVNEGPVKTVDDLSYMKERMKEVINLALGTDSSEVEG